MKDPERQDRPSVSKFADYEKCPAKFKYELEAPSIDEPNEWSAFGQDAHRAWSGLSESEDLPAEIKTVLASADAQLDSALEEIAELTKTDKIVDTLVEQRLWYPDNLYSGRPDKVFVFGDKHRTAFVPDLKSLWGYVPAPAINWQGRATVPLVRHNLQSKRVIFSIIQPNREWAPPAFYDGDRVEQAEVASLQLVASLDVEQPVPVPGEHCSRCGARLWCKAALGLPELTTGITNLDGKALSGLITSLPDRMLERVFRFGRAAADVTESAKKEMKKRVEQRPDDFPQWRLRSSGDTAKTGDVQEIFGHLREMIGIPEEGEDFEKFAEAYRGCLSLSLPELAKLVARVAGMSEDGARKTVQKYLMLRGLITLVPKERVLEEMPDLTLELE